MVFIFLENYRYVVAGYMYWLFGLGFQCRLQSDLLTSECISNVQRLIVSVKIKCLIRRVIGQIEFIREDQD